VADFDRVAAIVKPRKKRQISDEHRQILREQARKTGFQPTKPSPRTEIHPVDARK